MLFYVKMRLKKRGLELPSTITTWIYVLIILFILLAIILKVKVKNESLLLRIRDILFFR